MSSRPKTEGEYELPKALLGTTSLDARVDGKLIGACGGRIDAQGDRRIYNSKFKPAKSPWHIHGSYLAKEGEQAEKLKRELCPFGVQPNN